jgi:hypothetical protein
LSDCFGQPKLLTTTLHPKTKMLSIFQLYKKIAKLPLNQNLEIRTKVQNNTII